MSIWPNSNAVEGPASRRYSAERGWQTVRNFEGGETAIESKASELLALGYDIEITGGAVWRLTATVATNASSSNPIGTDEPVDTWELFGNESEKDLLQANVAAVNSIIDDDQALLRSIFEGQIDASQYRTSSPAFTSVGSGDPVGIWQLWLAGVKSVTFFQPVLRHTKTVSRAYEIPNSLTGVGQVYSTAQLIVLEAPPADIAANLGASSYVTKSGVSNQFYFGWFKCSPQITISAGAKRQLVQEWRWGLWPAM